MSFNTSGQQGVTHPQNPPRSQMLSDTRAGVQSENSLPRDPSRSTRSRTTYVDQNRSQSASLPKDKGQSPPSFLHQDPEQSPPKMKPVPTFSVPGQIQGLPGEEVSTQEQKANVQWSQKRRRTSLKLLFSHVRKYWKMIHCFIILDSLCKFAFIIFNSHVLMFELLQLNRSSYEVIVNRHYWQFIFGLTSCFVSGLTDTYVGKYYVTIIGNIIAIFGALTLIAAEIIAPHVDSITMKEGILCLAKSCFYFTLIVEPAQTVLLLEQCPLPENLSFVRRVAILMIWFRYLSEFVNEILTILYISKASYTSIPLLFNAQMLAVYVIFLKLSKKFLVKNPVDHSIITGVVKCTIEDVRLHSLKYQNKTSRFPNEIVIYSKRFRDLSFRMSPFIIFYVISNFLLITWTGIGQSKQSLKMENALAASYINVIIAAMSIINIPIMENCIFPKCIKKNVKADMKYFLVSYILLGFSVAVTLVVLFHFEYINSSDPHNIQGMAKMKLFNGINTTIEISSIWTKKVKISPGNQIIVRNIHTPNIIFSKFRVQNEFEVNYTKAVHVKEQQSLLFIICDRVKLIRINKHEEFINKQERIEDLTKVTLIRAVSEDIDSLILYRTEEELTHGLSPFKPVNKQENDIILPIPEIGSNTVSTLPPGIYEINTSFNGLGMKNVTKYRLRARSGYILLIHRGHEGKLLLTAFDQEGPFLNILWELPAMYLYSLAMSTTLITYISFVYVQSPPLIRTFMYSIVNYNKHIVSGIIILCSYHSLHFGAYSYNFFLFIFLLDLALFCYISWSYNDIDTMP